MELVAILGYVMQALDVVPKMLAAGQDIAGFVKKISDNANTMQTENRGPNAEEKAELDKIIHDLRVRLHSPSQ